MEHITIAGKDYPVLFNMATFRAIMRELKADLQGLAQKQTGPNIADTIDFMLAVAYNGMKTAAVKNESTLPFNSSDELAMHVTSVQELDPALVAYTAAWNEFLGVKPEAEAGNEETPVKKPAKKASR
jgi:hypothetical protein